MFLSTEECINRISTLEYIPERYKLVDLVKNYGHAGAIVHLSEPDVAADESCYITMHHLEILEGIACP